MSGSDYALSVLVAERSLADGHLSPAEQQRLVEEGRKLATAVHRAQWKLGHLALRYAPVGDPSFKSGAYELLAEYAERIGMEVGTLRNYRAVAFAWSGQPVGSQKFSILKALASAPDKAAVAEMLLAEEPGTVEEAVALATERGLLRRRSRGAGNEVRTLRRVARLLQGVSLDHVPLRGRQRDAVLGALGVVVDEAQRLMREASR